MNRLPYTNLIFLLIIPMLALNLSAQVDYKLWLQYDKISNEALAKQYRTKISGIVAVGNSKTIQVSSKELQVALSGLLENPISVQKDINSENVLILGSKIFLDSIILEKLNKEFAQINDEGFIIKTIAVKGKNQIIITAKTDVGVLYGVFNFLRLIQTNKSIENLNIVDSPKINVRLLNHWDNLN